MSTPAPLVIRTILLTGLALGLSGCSAFRASIDAEDPRESDPLSAKYDQRDLLAWGDMIANDLLSAFPPPGTDNPILVPMGIQNRTKSHMDMKAISDTVETKMLDSGKIQLVNADRRDDLLREQGYQLANCTDETKVKIGRQLGARYMLTGSLVEIEQESGREARLSKRQDVYYQLTVEITDLETGLITTRKQRDRLRRARKPLIGW